MNVCGLIVEYNPFHNGHLHHLNEAKKVSNADIVIAIMSPTFMQRGEPAIINKFVRTKQALDAGVDLIIELPSVYAITSADHFGANALFLLNELKVNYLVFGSESNDLTNLKINAEVSNSLKYQSLLKEQLQGGSRYAKACNDVFKLMNLPIIDKANDILALSYLKSINQSNYPITPLSIKRTNEFLDPTLQQEISSATAIRHALFNNQSIKNNTPMEHLLSNSNELVYLEDFYPLLKYQLNIASITQLQAIYGISEGLEYLLKKHINTSINMEDFINKVSSKRYPKTRIQRLIIYVLANITQDEMNQINIDYLRVLGMSNNGQKYLKDIKKECNLKIITTFSKHQNLALDIEHRITLLYSLAKDNLSYLYQKEYQQQVIKKASHK